MPKRRRRPSGFVWLALLGLLAGLCQAAVQPAHAQRDAWHAGDLAYRRRVDPDSHAPPPDLVVVEFFSHRALTADRASVAVYVRGHKQQVPRRLLQTGPGDFCRIAFQTVDRQAPYYIYYGGKDGTEPPAPAWKPAAGLLLETRHWRRCNLGDLQSVRRALAASQPIGSDYVADVFHRANPFAPVPAPFLSHYQGTLDIPKTGQYIFFTSSQDCSFLLIDGKQVVAAPGRHQPVHRARFRGEATLRAGPHKFEYLHAAVGDHACMVAAWQPPDSGRPVRIPARRFGDDRIARLAATQLEHRTDRFLPDFRVAVLGDVGLEQSDRPMVRVRFANTTATAAVARGRYHWDFGDGQGSDEAAPAHIYLHPGLYQVALTVRRGGKRLTTANHVHIAPPVVTPGTVQTPDRLADYIPLLVTYDPERLDNDGVLQLVRALLEADDPAGAVAVGRSVLNSEQQSRDDQCRWGLARLLGPVLRDRMNQPEAALDLWREASRRIRRQDWRAECAVQAADIALSDLLRRDEATGLLQSASGRLAAKTGTVVSQLHRLWGDWHARGGQADKALSAYQKAADTRGADRRTIEQNAWRGAYSRSTEALLRSGELGRARDELRRWQLDFPTDKSHGYLPLLLARYWIARDRPANAIAVAHDLIAINPSSPYADQLLLLTATCQSKLGHHDRAAAALERLVTDYPGSPMVKTAEDQLAELKDKR